MLTIAVSKGRIWDETRPLLTRAGCAPDETAMRSRSLIIPTARADVRLIVVRAQDAPIYVARGSADAGIAGSDMLAENPLENIYQPLDLKIACCRLAVAAKESFDLRRRTKKLAVATKYINLARAYFSRRGVSAEYVKLYGGMELAPLVGLADAIVDLVDSGATLRANGLVEIDVIQQVSAFFIINQMAARKNRELAALQQCLAEAVNETA